MSFEIVGLQANLIEKMIELHKAEIDQLKTMQNALEDMLKNLDNIDYRLKVIIHNQTINEDK